MAAPVGGSGVVNLDFRFANITLRYFACTAEGRSRELSPSALRRLSPADGSCRSSSHYIITGTGHASGRRAVTRRGRFRLKCTPYARPLCTPTIVDMTKPISDLSF
ncbi:hypothetical protein EVAR_76481_1 [Eumeta japonica]|uniref:Uncharacterized protein n=1 Tax=Eumeta variegata TaxID=151549 RepID=A0A4C1T5N4_EUMVA|nr:hypothetical protein EVAR_76481_1 [Eumeta japonica]